MSQDCSPKLKALADESRWKIVQKLLLVKRANVTTLAEELSISQPSVSKHLRILREAGIVVSEKEGTVVWCQVQPEFRHQLRNGGTTLDLGCCSFKFPVEEL